MESKGKRIVIIVVSSILAGILLLLAGLVGFLYVRDNEKICYGVVLADYDMSGMTVEEFHAQLDSIEEQIRGRNVTLDGGEIGQQTVSLERLGFVLDRDQLYAAAYQQGRSGNFFDDLFFKIKALLGTKTYVNFEFAFEKEACDAEIENWLQTGNLKLREHEIRITDTYVQITPGKSGYTITGDYFQSISEAIFNGTFHTTLEFRKETPKEIDVAELASRIDVDAVDANYTVENKKISFVEAKSGRKLDQEQAKQKLASLVEEGSDIFLNIETIAPELTVEQLENKIFNTTLSEYSSWYNRNLVNRSINVELAADFINGTVLAPGEVFSYNDVVGERTAARGFKNAQIYVQNQVVEGLGGGICQVSSTLYNAVLLADLEVVERRWHSLPVTYVPLGQDATVAFGYIDFQFKNNREYPIEVLSWYQKGNLYIAIKGTDDGVKREVKISNVTTQVLYYSEEVIEDSTLQPGERVVVTSGQNGYIVSTYKKVYEDGVLVSDEFLHTSKYNPTTQRVKVNSTVVETGTTPEPIPSIPPVVTPEPSPEPIPTPTPEPAPTPSSEPLPSVSPEPTPQPGALPAEPPVLSGNPASGGQAA